MHLSMLRIYSAQAALALAISLGTSKNPQHCNDDGWSMLSDRSNIAAAHTGHVRSYDSAILARWDLVHMGPFPPGASCWVACDHLEVDAELRLQGHAVQAVQVLAEQLRQLLPGNLLK